MKIRRTYIVLYAVLLSWLALCELARAAVTATPIYQIENVQGDFIQVFLHHDMYRQNLLRPDLKNLVVLDSEQNPLPYNLVNVLPHASSPKQPRITNELLFFPVTLDASPDTLRKLHSKQLQVGEGAVQVITSDKILDNKTPEFYLLDVSALDHAITALIFDWDAQHGNQYLEVELEGTRNLQDWVQLGRSTLVHIIQPQQSVKKNKIDIAIAQQEYQFLRLRVLRGAENLHINKIIAEHSSESVAATIVTQQFWSISGELAKEQVEVTHDRSKPRAVAAWEFVRSEATPVETVAIDFAQMAYSGNGKIWSRDPDNQAWQLQYQGIFFNVQIGSEWKTSEPVTIHRNTAKYWRVELNDSARTRFQPKLVFAWQPLALQIITNNKPPFAIAVSATNNGQDSRQVFTQLVATSAPVWRPATLISLDVIPQAIHSAQTQADWSLYLFWAALVVAVLVLLVFSWRLFKQIELPRDDG